MRRALRFAIIAIAAVAVVALLALGAHFYPSNAAEGLSRKDLMVGVLALGVLSFAAFGFDLRDWL